MKTSLPLVILTAFVASFQSSALADQLVITLRNGKTIVVDTAEISSMNFVGGGETVHLIPSPKNFAPDDRPPGFASVSFRPLHAADGNLDIAVNMSNGLPRRTYQVYLFVDGRNLMQPVTLVTDRTGSGQCTGRFQLPPGQRVLAVSIAYQNSEDDLFVTPGIYEKAGTTVTIQPPGPGFPGRPPR